jgi:hypothetical protein
MDRGWTFGIEHRTTVPVGGTVAVRLVLSTARGERTESGTDADLGRAIHADTFLWCAENDEGAPRARLRHQSEKSPATAAADGTGKRSIRNHGCRSRRLVIGFIPTGCAMS